MSIGTALLTIAASYFVIRFAMASPGFRAFCVWIIGLCVIGVIAMAYEIR